jgi:ferric uptake regulator family protein/rubrerythrin
VVLDVVRATESHPIAEWIHQMVRRRLPRVSRGTVYRNLRLLVAEGLVKELPGPHARFDGNVTEHHHFTCLGCGRITEVEGPTTEPHSRALCGRLAADWGLQRHAPPDRVLRLLSRVPAPCRRQIAPPAPDAVPREPRLRAAVTIHPKEDVNMAGKALKGSKSVENLKEAFAGESQANRRYLYFARVADIEGFPDIAGLFKDTADAETGHAFGRLDFLKEVGDSATVSQSARPRGT